MRVKHFRELEVWKKAHGLFIDLINDIAKFPKCATANVITSQIVRSVGSISSNIAEGFNALSTKEYVHYLDIAKRSTAESENWFWKLVDIGYMDREIASKRIDTCTEITKMLHGLMRRLKSLKSSN